MSAPTLDAMRDRTSLSATLLFSAYVAYVGFGDGVNYWQLKPGLGLQSPLTLVFPLVGIVLLLSWLRRGVIPHLAWLLYGVVLMALMLSAALVHSTLVSNQNLLGLGQMALFIALLPVVRGQFANSGPRLVTLARGSLPVLHYFLCGYVVASFVAWHVAGIDINVATPAAQLGALNDYYGFRPSGFGYEPGWTAFGIAATFIGISYLAPRHRVPALVVMSLAVTVLTSLTGFLFVVVFALASFARTGTRLRLVAALAILLAAAFAGTFAYRERISLVLSGSDPSVLMRLSSAKTALEIIATSFPLGVGYGNFQQFAAYTDPFVTAGLAEGALGFYKSDMYLLNVVAELGLGGVVLLVLVGRLFAVRGHYLPLAYFAILSVSTGTILVQAVLVVVAIVGVLERQCAEALGLEHHPRDLRGAILGGVAP